MGHYAKSARARGVLKEPALLPLWVGNVEVHDTPLAVDLTARDEASTEGIHLSASRPHTHYRRSGAIATELFAQESCGPRDRLSDVALILGANSHGDLDRHVRGKRWDSPSR